MLESFYNSIETIKKDLDETEQKCRQIQKNSMLVFTTNFKKDALTHIFNVNNSSSVWTPIKAYEILTKIASDCIQKEFPELCCKLQSSSRQLIDLSLKEDSCNSCHAVTVNIFEKEVFYFSQYPDGINRNRELISDYKEHIAKLEKDSKEILSYKSLYNALSRQYYKFLLKIKGFFIIIRKHISKDEFKAKVQKEVENNKKEIDYFNKEIKKLEILIEERSDYQNIYSKVLPSVLIFFKEKGYEIKEI